MGRRKSYWFEEIPRLRFTVGRGFFLAARWMLPISYSIMTQTNCNWRAGQPRAREAGVAVDALSLTTFGHWTTPENQPKRFATWFFATQVSAETNVEIDGSEIVDHRWLTVEDALELRASNEFTLPPPTFVSLKKLQRFSDSRTFLQHLGDTGAERFMPRVVDLDNGRCSLYQEDAGYDALDLALGGARHRLYMLESGWEYIREF
jgi:hypothetical protein